MPIESRNHVLHFFNGGNMFWKVLLRAISFQSRLSFFSSGTWGLKHLNLKMTSKRRRMVLLRQFLVIRNSCLGLFEAYRTAVFEGR